LTRSVYPITKYTGCSDQKNLAENNDPRQLFPTKEQSAFGRRREKLQSFLENPNPLAAFH
jgi:hypothetical protein